MPGLPTYVVCTEERMWDEKKAVESRMEDSEENMEDETETV